MLTPAQWPTCQPEQTVLGVVHNVTSATRLLDVLSLLSGDPRVETLFACTGSSPFAADVEAYAAARGMRMTPWDELKGRQIDLAVSASHGGALHELNAPIVILPHGMGYNKYLRQETGNRKQETGNRKQETGFRFSAGMAASR